MNFDTVLDIAGDILTHTSPAAKGTSRDAVHAVEKGARMAAKSMSDGMHEVSTLGEHAKEAVASRADEARDVVRGRALRTYDLLMKVLPALLPERGAKVRDRRIAYVTGGMLLGAAGIAVLEMVRPGTLASVGKRIGALFAREKAKVTSKVEDVKEGIDAAKKAASDVKQDAKEGVGVARKN